MSRSGWERRPRKDPIGASGGSSADSRSRSSRGARSCSRRSGVSGQRRISMRPPDSTGRAYWWPMTTNPEPIADTAVIAVRGSGVLSGRVFVPGAKNSVLKLMAATLLTDGTFEITNVPDDRRRHDHGRPPRSDRCVDRTSVARSAAPHRQRRPHAGRPVRARRADPRIGQRARTAADPLRPRSAVDARRRRLRCPADRHARRRARSDGRHVQVQPRLPRSVRRPAPRRRHHVRLPERRRHREPADRGGARRRAHHDRQRRS